MKPRIIALEEKKLLGCKQQMNYVTYNQFEKWAVVEVSDLDSKIVEEV
ncbi:hypothetical protein [Flavobacterium daejeonense]|nr:hypothetical protein [Flavobacterium daejeonense]